MTLITDKPQKTSVLKTIFNLRWQPDRHTWVAILAGIAAILLSLGLIPFAGGRWEYLSAVILRDLLMIFGLGFVLPIFYTLYMEKQPLSSLGLTLKHWHLMLLISLLLAGMLVFVFAKETEGPIQVQGSAGGVLYIMVAGIFEMLFFYGFLQIHFEKAFGIIPAILLAALFYSFHHAGFQPEFTSLFFVGVFYMSIFRVAGSLLVLYPFAWGTGALWDVLVDFGMDYNVFRWQIALLVLVLMAGCVLWIIKKGVKQP